MDGLKVENGKYSNSKHGSSIHGSRFVRLSTSRRRCITKENKNDHFSLIVLVIITRDQNYEMIVSLKITIITSPFISDCRNINSDYQKATISHQTST